MTEQNDNKKLLLFLKTLKQELLKKVDELHRNVIKRSELNDIVVFQVADNSEKHVIHEMVSEITPDGKNLTGQDNLSEEVESNQASNGTTGSEVGIARSKAASHFHSNNDKEAA